MNKKILKVINKIHNCLGKPRILIMSLVTIAMVIVSIFLYVTRPTKLDRLSMPYLDTVESSVLRSIQTSFDKTYTISDQGIYGETLTLYHKQYAFDVVDDLQGKNVILHNVQTNQDVTFTFSGGIDSGIRLGFLDEGLYEVYVYDQYTKKRVVYDDAYTSDLFWTMRRNNEVKSVQLIASQEEFEKYRVDLDKNYVFLTVMNNIPMVDTVDVMIDPSGYIYNEQTNATDMGVGNEASESYAFGNLVKKELEKYGLRVEFTRGEDESVSYYGKGSRVAKGYEKQAKIFLSLGMLVDEDVTRPMILVSPFTSGLLANEIAYTLSKAGLDLYGLQLDEELDPGVNYDGFQVDEDYNLTNIEYYPQLRETGGKLTFAGTADFASLNAPYKNMNGMNAIYFQYCSYGNSESGSFYDQNREDLAKVLAKGIASYCGLEEYDETTVE